MYRDTNRDNSARMLDGTYLTRYGAEQDRLGDEIAVKVCAGMDAAGRIRDGYRLMKISDYQIWSKQR